MSQLFDEKLQELNLVLTKQQKQQFDKFYELLVEWNKSNESNRDYRV